MVGTSVYSASKAALHSPTRTLSTELIGRGIRVNTITTGAIQTPILERAGNAPEVVETLRKMFASRGPVKRMGRPEEVAKVALFLASSDSSFVGEQRSLPMVEAQPISGPDHYRTSNVLCHAFSLKREVLPKGFKYNYIFEAFGGIAPHFSAAPFYASIKWYSPRSSFREVRAILFM